MLLLKKKREENVIAKINLVALLAILSKTKNKEYIHRKRSNQNVHLPKYRFFTNYIKTLQKQFYDNNSLSSTYTGIAIFLNGIQYSGRKYQSRILLLFPLKMTREKKIF